MFTYMEELYIQKLLDLLNNSLIFRFELHFGYDIKLQLNSLKGFKLYISIQPVEPQTYIKLGKNMFFLLDFQSRSNLTLL